ncbi:plasma membrane calcium [Savitreella phatthalungensis]
MSRPRINLDTSNLDPRQDIEPSTIHTSSGSRTGNRSTNGHGNISNHPASDDIRPAQPLMSSVTSGGEGSTMVGQADANQSGKANYLSVPGVRERASSTDSSAWSSDDVHVARAEKDDAELDARRILEEGEDASPSDSHFAFTNKQLQALVDPKNIELLRQMGGLRGLAKGLQSDLNAGLSWDETILPLKVSREEALAYAKEADTVDTSNEKGGSNGDDRRIVMTPQTPSQQQMLSKRPTTGLRKTLTMRSTMRQDENKMVDRQGYFGRNVLPARKTKNIFQLMWIALQDKVLILLSIAAVISLALGLYETFGTPEEIVDGRPVPHVEWVEGVAIIVAILIVTVVGSANDFQKERQFAKLNKKKEDRKVTIVRSGKTARMSVFDVQVGDVMKFEPGDVLPVDGVLIQGHNVRCDESAATGESDTLKKMPGDEALQLVDPGQAFDKKADPFMLSGGKVVEGVGSFLVTSVGTSSFNGKTMMALQTEAEDTPLQAKLNNIATIIAKLGGAAALLLFVVTFIEYLVRLRHNDGTASQKGQQFLNLLIIAITVVVVAVPEGLPLAVTLALAFATTRMVKDNCLVRILKSCETMGVATTICSDKTGTLTQNRMTVVAGTLSVSQRFAQSPEEAAADQAQREVDQPAPKRADTEEMHEETKQITSSLGRARNTTRFVTKLSGAVKDILLDSISLNSTAFEGVDEHGKDGFVGSKTETALLEFARIHLGMGPVATLRANKPVVHMIPFSSEKKCMGCVIKQADGSFRLFTKGASEIVLSYCSRVLQDPFIDEAKPITQPISSHDREKMGATIDEYADQSLRTIGLVYRDFPSWPPTQGTELDKLFEDMTMIGIVGIMDPLRPGVKDAVQTCKEAGVFVRMVTGDNVVTARAIARECGIYTEGGIVMEGPVFRKLSPGEMDQIIPRLQVLARSSPEDKQILVKRLKRNGETVAVTGDGTNDGPALKMADVGFSMGIAGTEVAKEASAIILMDDNFSSIIKAMAWGRAVNNAVKKFLQFQITVNITAVLLTFISAVSGTDETSVLTAVQLLWVNLIMDTLAALALATDPPGPSLLKVKPARKSDNLITFDMWKMIIGQSIYQLTVTLILYYVGADIFDWDLSTNQGMVERQTVVFNTFVWCQIFNQLNNRRLDNKLNVFEGILRNYFYIIINLVMIGGQVLIIFVGGRAFSVTRIKGDDWAVSIIVGAISIPIAIIIRLIPNSIIRIFVPRFILEYDSRKVVEISDESRAEWNPAINQVRDELAFIRYFRSSRRIGDIGRQKKSTDKYFHGDRERYRKARQGSVAAAIMMPSFVASSTAGFGPPSPSPSSTGRPSFNDAARRGSSNGSQSQGSPTRTGAGEKLQSEHLTPLPATQSARAVTAAPQPTFTTTVYPSNDTVTPPTSTNPATVAAVARNADPGRATAADQADHLV